DAVRYHPGSAGLVRRPRTRCPEHASPPDSWPEYASGTGRYAATESFLCYCPRLLPPSLSKDIERMNSDSYCFTLVAVFFVSVGQGKTHLYRCRGIFISSWGFLC